MNESENSLGRSIKTILGAFGIFVVFGFLALILSGFAGNESAEDRAFKGEFSEETTKARWANLEEIQKAQAGAFDPKKVDEALKKVGSTAAKPAKSSIVVPGSPTFLKQSQQPASAPAEAEAAQPKSDAPAAKPEASGQPAPKKEAPEPVSDKAPEKKEEPKSDGKPEDEAKPKGDAKAEAPAKPAPAPAEQ